MNGFLPVSDRYGETVLHYAVLSQKKKIVAMLLELGLDPRGGSGVNGTALDVAKASGHSEIYDMLLGMRFFRNEVESTPNRSTFSFIQKKPIKPALLRTRKGKTVEVLMRVRLW